MTIINREPGEQKISVLNPQGNLPEIEIPEDYKEEQMEFSMDIEIDSKKQFVDVAPAEKKSNAAEVIQNSNLESVHDYMEVNFENELQLVHQIENDPTNDPIDTPIDTLEAPLTLSEPISLPAALCDDLLLQEINEIPDKMGFKIGDVSDLLGIKQYVLRYWESEFDILKPKKAHNNQRLYTKKDVENAFLIRKLLHRDRFSIEGARSALKGLKAYVKKENLKEKEIKQAYNRIDSYQERLENLAFDVRRVRQLFK